MTETVCPPKPLCAADARVIRCAPLGREHVLIEIALPDFPASQPGQFVQLLCREALAAESAPVQRPDGRFPSLSDKDLQETQAFLRRPFSIADRWQASDGSTRLAFISHAVGPGTRWLARLRPADTLNLTGPLGNGFRLPPADTPLVLVGGGVGIPPLLYLARRLGELRRPDVMAIFGARTRALLPAQLASEPATDGIATPCVRFPGEARFPTIITSDDGSVGLPGLVTEALRIWHRAQRNAAHVPVVFACGPDRMVKAAAAVTRELGLGCQLCIERNMGCGLGTCLSCVVRARDESQPQGWRWVLACQEGPVFNRDDLLDYAPGAPA